MANLEKQYKDDKRTSLTQQDMQESKFDESIGENLKSVSETFHAYDDQVATVIAKVPYSLIQKEWKNSMGEEQTQNSNSKLETQRIQ